MYDRSEMRRATNSAAELERNLGLPGVLGSSSASPFERRRRAKVLLAPIRVIRFWYFEHHTLEMIGRKENVTRGRIQQIRDKALRRCLAVTRHRIGLLVLPILERMAFAGGELHITKLEQVFPGFDARLLLLALHIVGGRDFFFRRGEVLTRKGQGRLSQGNPNPAEPADPPS